MSRLRRARSLSRLHRARGFLSVSAALAMSVTALLLPAGSVASAGTDPLTLVGKGGSFLSPVTNLLLNADTPSLENLGLFNSYSDTNIDSGIASFVGSGPGQFDADFAVSERPLTSAESAQASSDGRSFAYVPIAATPVAIATLVLCTPGDLSSGTIDSQTFCTSMPLTPALVGEIFTADETDAMALPTKLVDWDDPRFTTSSAQPIPDDDGVGQAFALGPSEENFALMSLIDSDPTAKAVFDDALANPATAAGTTSDAPSEIWPIHVEHSYVGGDAGLLQKEISIIPDTNAPGILASWAGLHDAFPVSAVWTGAPLGTPWNVPTAAIENAGGAFVGPTEAAAAAAESDATLDPTTNLVSFPADASDKAAYNNYLMAETYLVVPTTTLPAAKALGLAQFIRFALGGTGQADVKLLGAAPATPAMVTAGLKVASELDAEAAVASTTTTTTATTSSTPTTVSPTGGSSSVPSTTVANSPVLPIKTKPLSKTKSSAVDPPASSPRVAGTSRSQSSAGQLAFSGFDPKPFLFAGAALVLCSEVALRRLRSRRFAIATADPSSEKPSDE